MKPLIPLLIDEGVDILNSVQVSAAGMDTTVLKQEFGKDVTFWGGGFVFNTVHNIQSDAPPENLMAMWETLQEYGAYHS